ncbi:MAG TPA: hypothetical protein VEA44_17575 [Caulobacter sp.]|nr:hypothetical protein [Caulobacter sp.]
MTGKLDKALALSATETELLRDLRSRLGRPHNDKAAAVLLNALFQAAARVDIAPPPGQPLLAADDFKAAVAGADMATLRAAVATLRDIHGKGPAHALKALADGLPQAVISRRLALAGREPALDNGML